MVKFNINGIEQELTSEQLAQYQVSSQEQFKISLSNLRVERNRL